MEVEPNNIAELLKVLEDIDYTCGATMQELLPPATSTVAQPSEPVPGPAEEALDDTSTSVDMIRRVFVHACLTCQDPVEFPYFSCNAFPDICIHSAVKENLVKGDRATDLQPTCEWCYQTKKHIQKRKRALVSVDGRAQKKAKKK